MIDILSGASDPTRPRDIFLPIVATAPTDYTATVAEFCRLMVEDLRQQRTRMVQCECLVRAATWRAHGLANGDPWSHDDRFGVTPNEYVRRAGCILPPSYGLRGNNVESLVNGTPNAQAAFDALANSERHSVHLFARELDGRTNEFFAEQWAFGVAVCEGGPAGWYWAVMIANIIA